MSLRGAQRRSNPARPQRAKRTPQNRISAPRTTAPVVIARSAATKQSSPPLPREAHPTEPSICPPLRGVRCHCEERSDEAIQLTSPRALRAVHNADRASSALCPKKIPRSHWRFPRRALSLSASTHLPCPPPPPPCYPPPPTPARLPPTTFARSSSVARLPLTMPRSTTAAPVTPRTSPRLFSVSSSAT